MLRENTKMSDSVEKITESEHLRTDSRICSVTGIQSLITNQTHHIDETSPNPLKSLYSTQSMADSSTFAAGSLCLKLLRIIPLITSTAA